MNEDILDYMWGYLDIPTALTIVKSCTKYNKKYNIQFYEKLKSSEKYNNIENIALYKSVSPDYLKYLIGHHVNVSKRIIKRASYNGNLELLTWFKQNDIPCINTPIGYAMCNNQLNVIKWYLPQLYHDEHQDVIKCAFSNKMYEILYYSIISYIQKYKLISLSLGVIVVTGGYILALGYYEFSVFLCNKLLHWCDYILG